MTKRSWINMRRESFAQSLEKIVTVAVIVFLIAVLIVFLTLMWARGR